MCNEPQIARIGSLIGSPARAEMLSVLFDGRAITAGELADVANVSRATASEHLSLLLEAGFVSREKNGRHQYYSLANSEIANFLEQICVITDYSGLSKMKHLQRTPDKLREARFCYDHIAGRLGVAITDALVAKKVLFPRDIEFDVTDNGEQFFSKLGISIIEERRKKRHFAKKCLDWSERRHHIAGSLGAAIASLALDQKWIRRTSERRVVLVTKTGERALRELLGVETKSTMILPKIQTTS